MEETIMTFESIVSQAAMALQNAVESYGPDAVDLALKVYWIEGIKGTLAALLYIIASIGLVRFVVFLWDKRKGWEADAKKDRMEALPTLLVVCASGLSVLFFFGFVDAILNRIYHIAAAFGYPELLIVAKALQAAGLL